MDIIFAFFHCCGPRSPSHILLISWWRRRCSAPLPGTPSISDDLLFFRVQIAIFNYLTYGAINISLAYPGRYPAEQGHEGLRMLMSLVVFLPPVYDQSVVCPCPNCVMLRSYSRNGVTCFFKHLLKKVIELLKVSCMRKSLQKQSNFTPPIIFHCSGTPLNLSPFALQFTLLKDRGRIFQRAIIFSSNQSLFFWLTKPRTSHDIVVSDKVTNSWGIGARSRTCDMAERRLALVIIVPREAQFSIFFAGTIFVGGLTQRDMKLLTSLCSIYALGTMHSAGQIYVTSVSLFHYDVIQHVFTHHVGVWLHTKHTQTHCRHTQKHTQIRYKHSQTHTNTLQTLTNAHKHTTNII